LSFRKANYVCLARSTARSDEKNNLDAECAIADAVENAKRILEKIDERWPSGTD
jgi:hypothetical protein